MFAASILLLSLSKAGIDDPNAPHAPGYQCVAMASEILDVMNESVVARKYADILRSSLRDVQEGASNSNRNAFRPFTTSLGTSPAILLSPPQSEVPSDHHSDGAKGPEGFMPFTSLEIGSMPLQIYGDFLNGAGQGMEGLDVSDWFLADPNLGGFG